MMPNPAFESTRDVWSLQAPFHSWPFVPSRRSWLSFDVVRLPFKLHQLLASFLAAGAALLPVLFMALSEISTAPSGVVALGEQDDAGYRGAGLALAAMPFLYLFAVPICYSVGALLLSLRLVRLLSFLAGATCIALVLGLVVGVPLGASVRFDAKDLAITVGVTTMLSLVTVLPAAFCWWLVAVRPHNPEVPRSVRDKAVQRR